MKKSRLFAYAALPVLGLGLIGAGTASANGFGFGGGNMAPADIAARQTEMFELKAGILGISVDEVKNAWAEGKTIQKLAEEKGITTEQLQEKMRATHLTQMKSHLSVLVSNGVITQAQADKRLETMQNMPAGGRNMGRGAHRGFGF